MAHPGLAWVKARLLTTKRLLESLAIEGRPIPLDRHELPLVATGGRDNNSGLDSEEGRLFPTGIKGEGADLLVYADVEKQRYPQCVSLKRT
jgi:hypothetical protein